MKNKFIIIILSVLCVFGVMLLYNRLTPAPRPATTVSKKAVVKPKTVHLPDTAFESVKALKWSIDISDSSNTSLAYTSDVYSTEDVLTFRKNNLRNADFQGKIKGTPTTIDTAWCFQTYYDKRQTKFGIWGGGTGWTGQPLYLHRSNEIIFGSLCGKVYFVDFRTGRPTRSAFNAVNPIKGTVSIDPEYHNLYIGQGVPAEMPFGRIVYDMNTNQQSQFIGRDDKALRGWNASDASAVIAGGYLFWPSENGSVYKYRRCKGGLKPVSVFRYTVNGLAPGIESSLCTYNNYGYFADNHGNIICLNLNNMHPVWHYNNHDDTDGSLVCLIENGTPYIYSGSEVDKQGKTGFCYIVKLNGLNGQLVWEQKIKCNRHDFGTKTLDGGMYCTPLLGRGDDKGLLFANISRNGADGSHPVSGQMVAIDTRNGHIVYTTQLNQFCWSSPVSFLNEKQEEYILTFDSGGFAYLIRGKTGEIVCKKHFGSNFESSAVVIGNNAVIGSRQNGIFKLTVK